jgi:hypothetical protein
MKCLFIGKIIVSVIISVALPFIVTEIMYVFWAIFEVTTFFQNFFWVFDFGHFFCPFSEIAK